jgi:hypothetical protein
LGRSPKQWFFCLCAVSSATVAQFLELPLKLQIDTAPVFLFWNISIFVANACALFTADGASASSVGDAVTAGSARSSAPQRLLVLKMLPDLCYDV